MSGDRLDDMFGLTGSSRSVTTVWRRSWNRKPGSPAAFLKARQAVSSRLRRVELVVLARAPQVVMRLHVAKVVGSFQHPLDRISGCLVERDGPLARLVLAVADVEHALARRA